METSPTFLKWRSLAFACISFISLLWIILLCIIVFERWVLFDRPEKAFISVLLITNTINLITLPILILCEFRPWLDAARMLLLISVNVGIAAFFTYWNPNFHCPEQTADSKGVCKLLNMYILLANWVDPGLLIVYSYCLAFLVWWRSRQTPSIVTMDFGDEEASVGAWHPSMVPTMTVPERASRRPSTIALITPTFPVTTPHKTPLCEWPSHERDVYFGDSDRKVSFGGESTISCPSRLSKQRLPHALY